MMRCPPLCGRNKEKKREREKCRLEREKREVEEKVTIR